MINVTNRDIAIIITALVIGTLATALAMTGFDVSLAAKLIVKRVAAGAGSGIIAAVVIVPIAVIIRHAIIVPWYE